MARIEIVTGDDVALLQTLKVGGVVLNLSAATAVYSRLLKARTKEPLTDATSQANTGQASWSTGVVEHIFSSAVTGAIDYEGDAVLETQVTLAGRKRTWFATGLSIVAGTIA